MFDLSHTTEPRPLPKFMHDDHNRSQQKKKTTDPNTTRLMIVIVVILVVAIASLGLSYLYFGCVADQPAVLDQVDVTANQPPLRDIEFLDRDIVIRFSMTTLEHATNNFSDENGFGKSGLMYRKTNYHQEIAVSFAGHSR